MYPRVKEICALAADYRPKAPECARFFQTMKTRLHFAVTGKTAAELIANRIGPNFFLTLRIPVHRR